jgi:hypothetical protein
MQRAHYVAHNNQPRCKCGRAYTQAFLANVGFGTKGKTNIQIPVTITGILLGNTSTPS